VKTIDGMLQLPHEQQHRFKLEQIEPSLLSDEMAGFCLACGEQSDDNCEPDARNYKCSACGEMQVFGASEILIMGLVD
jgi:hypothetical protein